jgi:hypothetical protein
MWIEHMLVRGLTGRTVHRMRTVYATLAHRPGAGAASILIVVRAHESPAPRATYLTL